MSLVLADLVHETTTTTGTGTLSLAGAVTNRRTFVAGIGTGKTTLYHVRHQSADEWETREGVVTDGSPDTLTRGTLIESSTGSAVSFSAGTKDVFCFYPGKRAIHGSLGSTFDPSTVAWVAAVDADNISGADGDAQSSVASGGTADAFVQATGANQPLLKKTSNGINGHNVLRFDGTNDSLSSTTGGASLTGDWYVAAVVRFSDISVHQNVLSWGDSGTNGARRSMFKFQNSGGTPRVFSFIGENADIFSDTELEITNVYLLEMQRSGTTVTLYVNGAEVDSATLTLVSYSSAALRLGVNNSAGERLQGDLACAYFLGSVPSTDTRTAFRRYLGLKYAIEEVVYTAQPMPVMTDLNKMEASGLYDNGYTLYASARRFWAVGSSKPHVFQTTNAQQNTLFIQNTNSDGYSCVVCLDRLATVDGETPSTSTPAAAFGWGTSTSGSGAAPVFSQAAYVESSDFTNNLGNNPPPIRFVTTATINGVLGNFLRMDIKGNGDTIIYDASDNYPDQVAVFTSTRGGNAVIGAAALATNATDRFLYVPSCAGTPTGTPTTYTGRVPIIVDSTNHKLYFFSGGSWRDAGP